MMLWPRPPTPGFFVARLVLETAALLALAVWGGFFIEDHYPGQGLTLYLAYLAVLATVLLGVAPLVRDRPEPARPEALPLPRVDPSGPAPADLVARLLEAQREEAERLPIGDIFGPRLALGRGVSLPQVFVPMYVAQPERGDGAPVRHPGPAGADGTERRPKTLVQSLADAIGSAEKESRGLRAVLVAEAGAGKSTAVGDLVLRCPPGRPAAAGEPLPDALRGRAVLRVNLRGLNALAFPGDAADPPDGGPIWTLVRRALCACDKRLDPERDSDSAPVRQACETLRERLQGRGLLLLDALDEVLDENKRELARRAILALDAELGPGCALLVTARPYAFEDGGDLPGFAPRWSLAPLAVREEGGEPSQMRVLIARWLAALAPPGADAGAEAAAARLAAQIAGDPRRSEMAQVPLLLTLFVGVAHARAAAGEDAALPADRAELLEAVMELVLDRWLFRIKREAREKIPDELTTARLRDALQRMALRALRDPARPRGGRASRTGLAVSAAVFDSSVQEALGEALVQRLYPARDLLRGRAGVLRRLGSGEDDPYDFIHREFQDYLAACDLVRRHQEGGPQDHLASALWEELRASPGVWREPARFAVLRLARGDGPSAAGQGGGRAAPPPRPPRPRDALAIARTLLGGADDPRRDPIPAEWEGLAVAALALADLEAALAGQAWTGETAAGLETDRREAKRAFDGWYERLVDERAPTPRARLDFGRVAGRLGDPRPGVVPAAWTPDPRVPFALDPLREIQWFGIPAGPFRPGSDPEELEAADERERAFEIELNPRREGEPLAGFAIARYPVTQAQFAAFVRAADGYGEDGGEPPRCWRFAREAGAGEGEDAALRWWRQYSRGKRARRLSPDGGDAEQGWPNHPAIDVSWYEAMAFCRWLTLQLETRGEPFLIRLPTEIEWERAARGPGRRRWPWGDDWRPDAANTEESGLGTTTAVGLFPAASPDEPRDLAGNVWEWTATRWGPDYEKPKYGWPLDNADDRDDPGGEDLRVVRGGARYSASRFCRGAFRNGGFPNGWYDDLGFRVVRVSLAHSDF